MNGKLQTNAKKDTKWSDGDSKMLNSKTMSGKVENLLGFYELGKENRKESRENSWYNNNFIPKPKSFNRWYKRNQAWTSRGE